MNLEVKPSNQKWFDPCQYSVDCLSRKGISTLRFMEFIKSDIFILLICRLWCVYDLLKISLALASFNKCPIPTEKTRCSSLVILEMTRPIKNHHHRQKDFLNNLITVSCIFSVQTKISCMNFQNFFFFFTTATLRLIIFRWCHKF